MENYESAFLLRSRSFSAPDSIGNHVGICLDTVNSIGTLETPERVVEMLAPLTVNLHIKDFVIEPSSTQDGLRSKGGTAGAGRLAIPWLLEQMPHDNNVSTILEQWPPPQESVEANHCDGAEMGGAGASIPPLVWLYVGQST